MPVPHDQVAQVPTTDSHCPYCALQCAQRLADLLRASDRLTQPLRRTADGLVPTTWDDALDDIAARVRALRADHGPDAVAVFGGGGLTNEKAYQLGKFARLALRTRLVDYNGRFCMASAAAAANRSLGVDRGLPFPLTDLDDADAVLLLGSNLADTMPPSVQHLAGPRARGGLVVVDPRRSATARLCDDGAGTHLQPLPGTDLVLLLGLLHVVLGDGLADVTYLDERVDGVEDVRRSVAAWWPERVETVTGVPAGQLRSVAHRLADASPHRGGYGALTGQGNGQGGREHGQKADQLPGYRSIEDPADRAHVAAVWGVDPELLPRSGVPAVQLLSSLGTESGPRGLFVHGSNVVVSAPRAGGGRPHHAGR